MTLYINTIENNFIEIGVKNKNKFLIKKKFASNRTQAERLLPAIDKLLKTAKLKLTNLKNIEVANKGGSFTSLRIGVVTANAIGYALGIPVKDEQGFKTRIKGFSVVEPLYDRQPEISIKKSRFS